LFNGFERRASH